MNKIQFFLQLMRFGIIGLLAAMVHFAVVVFFVEVFLFEPLIANIFAFLIAFQVGYLGHRFWTFRGTGAAHKTAFLKLFILQTCNFFVNEGLFYFFMTYAGLSYPLALIIVLAILPILTFMLSKQWIFVRE